MFPDFQYVFQSLFHTNMPAWLSIFKTFGFFVALSFFAAALTLSLELKRKEEEGFLLPEFSEVEVGRPASPGELFWSAVVGFLLGYKIGGMFGHVGEIAPNPMGYMFSIQGSLTGGIAGALIMGYAKYAEKKKQQLDQPVIKKIATYPHHRVFEFAVLAAIGGLVGAKVFNAFETWDDFLRDPAANLLSSSGLTFYGGLIVAAIVIFYYARRHKISFRHLCDAAAPGLMLAYGIGRLGCHFAGDGDWGIFNTAYITEPNGALRPAGAADQANALHLISNAPHAFFSAPTWLPRWLFAMNYPHNVNHDGMPIMGCIGDYCSVLPVPVFPTPIYEAVTCILLFCLLWSVRERFKSTLHLFGFYLILNGIERFLIELIRVNYKYDWGFVHPTQAEIISVLLVIAGACLLLFYKDKESLPPGSVSGTL